MKKRFTALLLMLAILIIPAAAASTYRQQIAVEYGITLDINGQQAVLKDPNGNTVQPFVYNGTTYVPIRAVSEMFNADIIYNSDENKAYIYDDYTEILVAAYMLEKSTIQMQNTVNFLFENVRQGYTLETTAHTQISSNYIANNRAMLTRLSTENSHYNILTESSDTLGSFVDHYNSCVALYQDAVAAYATLSASKVQGGEYLDRLYQANSDMLLPQMLMSMDVETLMKNSTWRDITDM